MLNLLQIKYFNELFEIGAKFASVYTIKNPGQEKFPEGFYLRFN